MSLSRIFVDEEQKPEFWLEHSEATTAEHAELAAKLQKRIKLGNVRRIQTEADLAAFRTSPSDYDAGGNCVLFRPSAPLLRKREFLKDVAETLSPMNGWYLVLEGSLLAHAPYQLRSLGLRRVISVWEYAKAPRKTQVGKLVRDKVPETIEGKGEQSVSIELPHSERLQALRAKLVEESLEVFYADDGSATAEELADVLTVIRAIMSAAAIPWEKVEEIEQEKSEKRGRFERGIFLSTTAPGPSSASGPPSPAQAEVREAVRRLRYRTGMAINLVPPYRQELRKERLRFTIGGHALFVIVEYQGSEVIVSLNHRGEPETNFQLDFFELLDAHRGSR